MKHPNIYVLDFLCSQPVPMSADRQHFFIQILLFSATFPLTVESFMRKHLKDP